MVLDSDDVRIWDKTGVIWGFIGKGWVRKGDIIQGWVRIYIDLGVE